MSEFKNNEEIKISFERYMRYSRRCLSLDMIDNVYCDEETQKLWTIYASLYQLDEQEDVDDKKESRQEKPS